MSVNTVAESSAPVTMYCTSADGRTCEKYVDNDTEAEGEPDGEKSAAAAARAAKRTRQRAAAAAAAKQCDGAAAAANESAAANGTAAAAGEQEQPEDAPAIEDPADVRLQTCAWYRCCRTRCWRFTLQE